MPQNPDSNPPTPTLATDIRLLDLLESSANATHSGPQLGHASADFNVTLLTWIGPGTGVAPHINHDLDVIFIGVEGEGIITINGVEYSLQPGKALLIAKGTERAARSNSQRFSYLSIHCRRPGLQIITSSV